MEAFWELIKAIFIGIVQGITEWLPISSTGHMILADEFIKLNVSEAFRDMFFVVIQLGSILAVVVLYFHKLNPFSPSKTPRQRQMTVMMWLKVAVAAVPAALIGFLFDDDINYLFYNYLTVAVTLILYGVLFLLLERHNQGRAPALADIDHLSYRTALGIGLFQILALIPGTSRSGSTILGAMFLGCSRSVAAEFSFFLAIPMMFGASGYKLIKYFVKNEVGFNGLEWSILIAGTVTAFVVSLFAIRFLMNYIRKKDFKAFGWYRIVLGALVLVYFGFFA